MRYELYAAGEIVTTEIVPDTPEMVDSERDRRTDAGFDFAGTRFQSRPSDRENIAGAAQLAALAMMAGAQPGDLRWHGGVEDFAWIAANNSLVPMDAPTVIAFAKTAAAAKSALIFAARVLKDRIEAGEVIEDCTDPAHWP